MKTWRLAAPALFLSLLLPLGLGQADNGPAVAPVGDQVDSWHDVQVHDPCRYMTGR